MLILNYFQIQSKYERIRPLASRIFEMRICIIRIRRIFSKTYFHILENNILT